MMMTKEELCSISGVSREILDNGLECITLNGDVTDHLPCQLKLYGLTLQGCISLQSLPEDLDIKYLSIRQCPGIVRLPESLQLEQLYLFQSEIDVLPVHSSCWKELVLIDCPNIRRIPDVCTAFAGDLFLEGCKNLQSLPAIKSVYGNLNIARTPIRHLPENIIIGNDLEAYCSDIETLPENSRIGGNICLSGCKNLKSLPDGLVVNGDLDLNESSLMELPDRLIVGGNLDIRSTSIQRLPDDLVVGGKIKMDANQANVSNVRTGLPADLPLLIWKDSGYMYVKDKLYKVIEQHDDYWIVIAPILNVYREITGSDSIDSEYRFYVMKNGSHYGIGNGLKEAQLDLSSTSREREQ